MSKEYKIKTVKGTKSIPIRNMPPEAWRSILGADNDNDIYKLASEVPWLYRSINVIAEAIVGLPRDEEAFDNLGLDADLETLLNELVGDYLLTGAMFICLEANPSGLYKTLRRFHPKTIKLVTDADEGLTGFKRTLSDSKEAYYSLDELGYSWIPSRTSEIAIGDAPAISAIKASGLLASIDEHAVAYFEAGAINPTIAKIQDFQAYPEAEQQRTKSILERLFGRGKHNAHRIAPVGTNVEFETIGSPMSELAVPELTKAKREDISTALGIPQSILFSNAANFATAQQDNRSFYEKTIIPLARKLEALFNRYFKAQGLAGELIFNEQTLEIFQTDEALRSGSLKNLVEVGIPLSIALDILGYDLSDEQILALTPPAPEGQELEADDFDESPEGQELEAEAEAEAEADIKAISSRYAHINFKPNDEMVSNAKRGLELRAKYNRGGTRVGLTRANQIAKRQALSPNIVLRMYSYFARHEVDKREGWANPSNPSNGYIAWLLWGGDAGQSWARARRNQMIKADEAEKALAPSMIDELTKWRKKSLKSFKTKGKAYVNFNAEAIPSVLKSAIEGALSEADSPELIDSIFNNAIDLDDFRQEGHEFDGYI